MLYRLLIYTILFYPETTRPEVDNLVTDSVDSDVSKTEVPPVTTDPDSCLLNNLRYNSGDNIPVNSPCQQACVCNKGSIQCRELACPMAPPDFLRCTMVVIDGECCPTFDCGKC